MEQRGERDVHALVMDANDNVATSVCRLTNGTEAIILFPDGGKASLVVSDEIPAFHKFALREISKGSPVLKYGCPIGQSISTIQQGEHVHLHNMFSLEEANEVES